jgi:gamma-tubulin complex component 2
MRYQIIFRFLLHLKHIERVLSSMWLDQKAPVWREPLPMHPELDKWRNRVFLLRAKMLAFVQQVLSFSALDVLEPNWKKFEERIVGVKTVDELMRDHVDFLDTCLKGCMLTNSKLLKVNSISVVLLMCRADDLIL